MRNSFLIQNFKKTLPINLKRNDEVFCGLKLNKRLIAMDIGTQKTGISITDKSNTMVMPWGLVKHDWNGDLDDIGFKRLHSLFSQSSGIIVGYPLQLDGSEGSQCFKTLKILNNWQAKFGRLLPSIYLMDERMSTSLARNDYQGATELYGTDILASLILLEAFLGLA